MTEVNALSATHDNLALARKTILVPGGLDEQRLDRTLGLVMDHAIDAADLYFQVSREESWALEDGIVKEGSASIEEGVGVRAISGEKTGFAYSDEIQPAALEEASRAARAIAKQSPGKGVQAWHRTGSALLYQPIDPLTSMDDPAKVAWLARVDRETRAMDPRIKQVMASCHAVLRDHPGGQLAMAGSPPTCGRWCVSMSRSSSSRTAGASRVMPVRAVATRWLNWWPMTGR